MSKASRQSLALLAVINGVFKTISEYDLAPDLMPTVLYGEDLTKDIIEKWPETGNPKKNTKWILTRIHRIDDDLNKSKSVYTMIVLTSLTTHIIADILQKLNDKAKIKLLLPLEEVIINISDAIDTNKDQFDAYEEADRLIKKLYKYLEFSI